MDDCETRFTSCSLIPLTVTHMENILKAYGPDVLGSDERLDPPVEYLRG